jgi:hypothetical protein
VTTVTVSKHGREQTLKGIALETLQHVGIDDDDTFEDHFRYLARRHQLGTITKAEAQKALKAAMNDRRAM